MKNITVKNCNDCPFSYREYDDYAVGEDTIEICLLAIHHNQKDYIIDVYNQFEKNDCDCEEVCSCIQDIIETPGWCHLKQNNYNIKYE